MRGGAIARWERLQIVCGEKKSQMSVEFTHLSGYDEGRGVGPKVFCATDRVSHTKTGSKGNMAHERSW